MTHTYTVTGLTCNNCATKVKNVLLKNPEILSADIDLESQQAVISMKHHIPIDQLQNALAPLAHYSISERPVVDKLKDKQSGWLATYKPLVLIFLFLTVVSFLTSTRNGSINILAWLNSFMAGFFLVFSFFKFLDLKTFAKSYKMYDLLAAKVPAYGLLYPFLELALGIAYLTGFQPFYTNLATVIVMGFSSLGVIKSVVRKQEIQCACLGAVFNLPMTTITIVEDLLMVAMAAVMMTL